MATIDAVLGGCGIARPFEVAARHWIATGQLREVLVDWAGERQAIGAVFPSHVGMRASKVKLYTAHVVGLLGAAT